MTENQGDLVGSAIVLLSTALLLVAVHRASSRPHTPQAKWLVMLSGALSVAGVAIVILT